MPTNPLYRSVVPINTKAFVGVEKIGSKVTQIQIWVNIHKTVVGYVRYCKWKGGSEQW